MKSHPSSQSTTELIPLPKSAAAATRCSGETASPATTGRRSRNHAVPGPATPGAPTDGDDVHGVGEARVGHPLEGHARPSVVSGREPVVRPRPAGQRELLRADPQTGGPGDLGPVGEQPRLDQLHLLARPDACAPAR